MPVFGPPTWCVPGPPLAAALPSVEPLVCASAKDEAPANNAAAIANLIVVFIPILLCCHKSMFGNFARRHDISMRTHSGRRRSKYWGK